MPTVATEKLRNVVLLSHSGAGKTALSEAMLLAAGDITRMGTTEDGTTSSDFEAEEVRRKTSIQTSVLPCNWKGHKVNVLDTPGYSDFRGEVMSGLRVADGAVIVVAGPSGVEVGTSQMWRLAGERGLTRMVFVSKLDRDNADFQRVMDSVVEAFGRQCVPIQMPIGSEAQFSGSVNLMDQDADVPQELREEVEAARERLVEAVAETDDDLATKFLEGEGLTSEELAQGLKQGVASGDIVPVIVGAPTSGLGAAELLDAVVDLMASPTDSGAVTATSKGEDVSLTHDPEGPVAALVFKTAADPFVGKLSYFRVYSGTFKSDSQVWNDTRNEAERVGQVFVVRGKSQEPVDGLAPGDIGAVAKLSSVLSGDTLSERNKPSTLPGVEFPPPVYQMSVLPKSKADVDKMASAMARIVEEDPSLRVTREPDTKQMLLEGLGDTHVSVAVEKIQRKFGVEILLEAPKVPYQETVSGSSRVEYRHKKQTGGHGQFAHVWLEVEPNARGSGFEFAAKVVGGSVPKEYIPSVQKGCLKAMDEGVIAGYPVVDVKATLVDGSFHPVDSSGVSFEIAGSHAIRDGIREANPMLLEPIMRARIIVPESDAGDVMGDMNSKRARILGMIPAEGGATTIEVEVPQAEMLRYATELRSLTQGRGSFAIEFERHEEVPGHMVDRIVGQLQEARAGA